MMEPILLRIDAGQSPQILTPAQEILLTRESFRFATENQRERELSSASQYAEEMLRVVEEIEGRLGAANMVRATERTLRDAFNLDQSILNFEFERAPKGTLPPIGNTQAYLIEPPQFDLPPVEIQPAELGASIKKRRCINFLTQGGAFFAKHFIQPTLEKVGGLPHLHAFEESQRAAELLFLMLPEEQIDLSRATPIALSRIKTANEPLVVEAKAPTSPLLLHEGVKGILECVALHGLPGADLSDDSSVAERRYARELRKQTLRVADNPQHEVWDRRLGIALWSRLFGERLSAESLVNYRKLVRLPFTEFFTEIGRH